MAGEAGFSSQLSKAPLELSPNQSDYGSLLGVRFSSRLMAGEAGFEPTHDGVKVRCLTAWLLPTESPTKRVIKKMGWDIRVELMTSSATNWRPNQLGQSHHNLLNFTWQSNTNSRHEVTYHCKATSRYEVTHHKFQRNLHRFGQSPNNWRAVGDSPLNYRKLHRSFLPISLPAAAFLEFVSRPRKRTSKILARCGGLEPPAYCLEGSCSIQLS